MNLDTQYNFANNYSISDFNQKNSDEVKNAFIRHVAFWEGRFACTDKVGINYNTGLTYDGK